jgi:hypothetical protein
MRNAQDCVVRQCSACLPILLAMPTIAYGELLLSVWIHFVYRHQYLGVFIAVTIGIL